MKNYIQIKNCPCCNSKAILCEGKPHGHMGHYIACTKCLVQTRCHMNVEKLIDVWNTRVSTTNNNQSLRCNQFRCTYHRLGYCSNVHEYIKCNSQS